MSTHINVECKGSTLHGHVCMIEIFELMVNLSTENELHCIIILLNIGMKIHSCLNLVRGECLSLQIVLFLKLNTTFLMFQNKTKLRRWVFVWMVERAGNNNFVAYFLLPFPQV